MENIDEINSIEQKKTSLFSNSLKYGLYTGIASVLLSLIFYTLDLTHESYLQWLGYVILITGIVLATINYRDKLNGGFISYGNAFLTGLYVTIITAIITVFYFFIYINYIDPNFTKELLDMSEQNMVDKGYSDEMIDQQLSMASKFMSPVWMLIFGFGGSVIMGVIFSLITSAILKKNDDSFNATFNQ